MKFTTLLKEGFILLLFLPLLAQGQKDYSTPKIKTNAVYADFTLLVVPTSYSTLEYYQLGFDKFFAKRTAFGVAIGVTMAESDWSQNRIVRYSIAFGWKWILLPNSRWYIDPALRLQYFGWFEKLTSGKFRGTGPQLSFNIGYRFKNNFGLGVRLQTSYVLGYLKWIENNEAKERFGYGWIPLDYGLNFTYNF